MIAFGILGMCNWLARWYDPKKTTAIDELIDTYFNMIAFGLVKNPARGKVTDIRKNLRPVIAAGPAVASGRAKSTGKAG